MARYPAHLLRHVGQHGPRAGTEGGFLEDALDRVGAFTELQEDLEGANRLAHLAYPVFLFSVGTRS